MDTIQLILIIVVITLTILLLIVGYLVIMVIVDLRKSLKRLNTMLDDAVIGGGLIKPNKITSLLEMMKKDKKIEKRGGDGNF